MFFWLMNLSRLDLMSFFNLIIKAFPFLDAVAQIKDRSIHVL